MMQDPSLQNITPELAKAMIALNQNILNEKDVVIQPKNETPETSAGFGNNKEQEDGQAPAKQPEQDGDENTTEKSLSGTEKEKAITNGEDTSIVARKKKR